MTTIDIIKKVLNANPEIASVKVIGYETQKDLKKDSGNLWTHQDEDVYQNALKLRAEHNVPFWNGIMLSCINNPNWSETCLSSSLRHNKIHLISEIPVSEIGSLQSIKAEGDRKSINSEVKLIDGSIKHIPMLDFHIPFDGTNTDIVKAVCKFLGRTGYILASGRSYHFIGTVPFTYNEMIEYLSRALLFTPIVDEIWIAHQIQDKSCSLRYGIKHGVLPTLICEI